MAPIPTGTRRAGACPLLPRDGRAPRPSIPHSYPGPFPEGEGTRGGLRRAIGSARYCCPQPSTLNPQPAVAAFALAAALLLWTATAAAAATDLSGYRAALQGALAEL